MSGAETIGRTLGLRRAGREYTGACPCCGYKSGFAITERDGRLLLYCAAGGCDQRDLWIALRKAGLAPESEEKLREPQKRKRNKPAATDEPKPNTRAMALAIWRRTVSSEPLFAPPTLTQTYLRARGYMGPIPSVIRFAPALLYKDTGERFPAMVAAVELVGESNIVAVHRTFLWHDGTGKAPVERPKMSLGNPQGGAVRLAPAGPVLAVSEGIETALSYMQVTGVPTWAALSTSGIRNLVLPPEVEEVVIAADPDIPGMRAAREAARRWLAEGRLVRVARPPVGHDFNDLMCAAS